MCKIFRLVLFWLLTEMKLLSLFGVFLVFVACANAINVLSVKDQWNEFKIQFNKTYKSVDEEGKRFAIFKDNCRKFDEHNKQFEAGKFTFKMGVSRDADLTYDEIDEREKIAPS